MTGYFVGVDGGGSKTIYALADESGSTIRMLTGRGISYRQYGEEGVVSELIERLGELLSPDGISLEAISGICIGLPCYGEQKTIDERISEYLKKSFAPAPVHIVNDVVVAFTGAIPDQRGIVLISGTGSIAYGMDDQGASARSGGWSEFFSDERSCYWIAKKGMELFTKEADGRECKGPLYDLVRDKLLLEDDFDFVEKIEKEYLPYRDRTASFQKLIYEAAQKGDRAARIIYTQAAYELFLLVIAVKHKLDFHGQNVKAAYAGGAFHAQTYLIPHLSSLLRDSGVQLVPARFSPVEGALLLAKNPGFS